MELEQGEGSGLRDASARRGSGVTGTVPRVLTIKVGKSRATAAQLQNQEEQFSLLRRIRQRTVCSTAQTSPRTRSNKAKRPLSEAQKRDPAN
jgi:hypothetical protein